MTTEKMRVSASSVINNVAETSATPITSRRDAGLRKTALGFVAQDQSPGWRPAMYRTGSCATGECSIDEMHWLRRAFVGAAMAWPMALLLAPVAAARPQPSSIGYAFALVIYAAGSLICHQRPERSFHLLGAQLPVCARCLGIYAGAALISVIVRSPRPDFVAGAWPVRRGPPSRRVGDGRPAPRTVLLVSALPTAATLLVEWTTGHTPGNWTRAVSGVPLGAAVAWIVSGVR